MVTSPPPLPPLPPPLPPFTPRLVAESGSSHSFDYDDGRVWGSAVVTEHADGSKALGIYEWASEYRDQGCSVRSLQWFREQGFTTIEAHGVGTLDDVDGELVPDIATTYWAHMHAKGLVDTLIDDLGNVLAVLTDEVISFVEGVARPSGVELVAKFRQRLK